MQKSLIIKNNDEARLMNKIIYLSLFILLLLISNDSYASYSNGFFGMIVLYFTFPMPIIGLIFSLVNKKKFNDDNYYFNYKAFWIILSILIYMTSIMIFGGEDPTSFLLLFFGLAVYNIIIFIPAIIHRIKNKNN